MANNLHNPATGWQALIILVAFSLFVSMGGLLFFMMQKKKVLVEKQQDLNAIINLKVEDIADWRKEHIRDARILGENPGLVNLINDFLNGREEETTLRNIFLPMIKDYDYQSILIADTNNSIRFSSSGKVPEGSGIQYIPDISGHPDLKFSADSSIIFMDVIFGIINPTGIRTGTLIMRVDPDIILYPHIQTWPVQSRTSETLLLRQEGDSILYLNELRHRKGTALKLRLPASDKNLPAARVITGYEGFFEGRDYRGVDVISYLKKIPDSRWFMVAKIDKSEIYAPLKEQFILISIIVLLTITTFSIVLRLYSRNQRIRNLNDLNQTRGKLYSIISHDLKNPFVSIMGFSELLYGSSMKGDHSKTTEFASIIYSSSRNAINLLHNLTGWTKLQTGKTLYNPQELDIACIINEVVEFSKPAALMKSISIIVFVPSGLKLNADKEMIGTILRNLIHNAIKFSFKQSEVKIIAGRNGNNAEIEVTDSGIGMDKQTIEKLLDLSYIQSNPGTSNEKGTGLGLYICREFISIHEGVLEIRSEPGKGSRFIVKLPLNSN